jgi:hypothetical protein
MIYYLKVSPEVFVWHHTLPVNILPQKIDSVKHTSLS